ncbi:MAG: hypothetical protein ACE5GH_04355 [Fidelibacterota bacterium]
MASFRELFSRARLEYKILLVLVLGLTVGFGSYVIYTVQAESSALLEQHRQKSRLFAESLKSGLRNMMLSGRPSYVRSLIEEAREEFRGIGRLKVFNNESMEIFSERSQFVSVVAHDSSITLFMTGGVKPAGDSRHYELLENETTCQQCHGTDHAVRGLLQTEFSDRSRETPCRWRATSPLEPSRALCSPGREIRLMSL